MRLSIDITPKQHQLLETASAIQGKCIKNSMLERTLPTEAEQKAFTKLDVLLAQRSKAALEGKVTEQTIDTIFDEEIATHST